MKNIAVIPIYKELENNKIFENTDTRDNVYEPMRYMRSFFYNKGYILNTIDQRSIQEFDYFLFYRIDLKLILNLFFNRKISKSIYIPLEPEVVDYLHTNFHLRVISNLFSKVLTWNDTLLFFNKFYKLNWVIPYPKKNVSTIPFKKKSFY